MNHAYLSLGSNEGDRTMWMKKAADLIAIYCGTITGLSSLYETAAWGIATQPDFLNQVLVLDTELSPETLLQKILEVEQILGRHRTIKWGPRTIDIDILFFNEEVINSPELIVPHPFLHERRFILEPLAEIAPAFVHPIYRKTILKLLNECPDKLEVRRIEQD